MTVLGRAQLSNECMALNNECYNVLKGITQLTKSWDVPVGSFTFSGLNDEQKNAISGYGLREETGKKNTFIGSPSPSILSSIYSLGPITTRATPGNVNIDGYTAYTLAIKAYQLYSSVMRGSAPSGVNYIGLAQATTPDLRATIIRPDGSEFLDWNVAKTLPQDSVLNAVTRIVVTSFDRSKTLPGSYTSTGEDLVDLPGIFFPYFNSMVTPDKSTIKHVFEAIFYGCIGSNMEVCNDTMQRVKSGVNNFAYTSAGRSLSHLYRGIQLSANSNTIITAVVINSVYHGFVLQGSGIRGIQYGRHYGGMDREKLCEEIRNLNKTTSLLADIVAVLNAPADENGEHRYAYTPADINTSRKFVSVYNQIDLGLYTIAQKANIRQLMNEVVYSDTFLPPAFDLIHDFCRFVETGDLNIIAKYPAYVGSSYFEMTDRISLGLGIFGPEAPSLNYGETKDMKFTLPRDPVASDPNLEVTDKKRHLAYLPFHKVSIRQAQVAWTTLLNKGEFYVPRPRKAKKGEFTDGRQVDYRIMADQQFMQVYTSIKVASSNARDAIRSGKRAHDGSGEERTNVKRGRKDAMAMEI